MAELRWRYWPSLMVLLLLTSFSTSNTSATPMEENIYKESSLKEVMEIPSKGTTRVCVVPLNNTTRLKVLLKDTEGGGEEVAVKRKSLAKNTLSILEIEVQTSSNSKPDLRVRLNGTQLTNQEFENPVSPAPQQTRTDLLLKGHAKITICTATPETRGGEMPRDKEGQMEAQAQEEEVVTTLSTSSVPSFPTDAPINTTSEETEDVEEDSRWSFLLVLGKVGEVPVLALLVGGVLLGALLGGAAVCCCSKVCEKRRVKYEPVSVRQSHSLATNDFIRETNFWELRERNSGIDSAFSSLTRDNGSQIGTGVRSPESANNSIDRSIRSTTHLSVNNLGRGTTGSPSNSTGRGHNNTSSNTLNIPYSSGMTRYGSQKSTGFPDNRDAENSMLPQGSGRTRTLSNRSTTSSINRNINRSPNIPYTKTLGTLTGHQDPSMTQKHNPASNDDSDSDDSNYEKPYVTRPIVVENYSVPHSTQVMQLERPTNTVTASPDKPSDRQVPQSQFATFLK